MKLKKYYLLLICSSLLFACGDFTSKKVKKSLTQESPEPPKDNEPPEDAPKTQQPIHACYYSPNETDESCLLTIEATEKQKLNDYAYRDPQTSPRFPAGFNADQYLTPSRYIPLNDVAEDIQLTPHFKINELMQRFKGELALFSPDALFYIEKMRSELQKAIIVHSGYRSPGYNTSLSGAATWSRHMYGDAIDFHVNGVDFEALAEKCIDHGATFYQIYTSHIHCDWRNVPLNDGFYKSPIKNQKFVNYKQLAQEQSHIHVEENNRKWKLSVNSQFIEDQNSDLFYKWEVTRNNKTKTYHSSTISLKKRRRGNYHIKVTVGGSIELEKKL